MANNEQNLKLIDYYIRSAISIEEARKEMNEAEKKDLSAVSGWVRQTTNQLNIQFVDPITNVIWKFYHYEPINMAAMMGNSHINGLIGLFVQ